MIGARQQTFYRRHVRAVGAKLQLQCLEHQNSPAPSDLPIQQNTKVQLVINLKTAMALRLAVLTFSSLFEVGREAPAASP